MKFHLSQGIIPIPDGEYGWEPCMNQPRADKDRKDPNALQACGERTLVRFSCATSHLYGGRPHLKGNPVTLVQATEQHAMNYESTQYLSKTILESLKGFLSTRQRDRTSACS